MPPKKRNSRKAKSPQVDTEGACSSSQPSPAPTSSTRKKKNLAYHPVYDEGSVAQLPDILDGKCQDDDNEELVSAPPEDFPDISEEDERVLKQEISHLPFEIVLKILRSQGNDVMKTIEMAKEMDVPDLVPNYVKNFFTANIADERAARPNKGKKLKKFYFEKKFRKVVGTKNLVNYYYNEKNRVGNSTWRKREEEAVMSDEQQVELAKKMKSANISLINCNIMTNSDALDILRKEEEDISSENSESEEKPPQNEKRSSMPKSIFRQRATTCQPQSSSAPGPSTSSPSGSPAAKRPRRSGRISN